MEGSDAADHGERWDRNKRAVAGGSAADGNAGGRLDHLEGRTTPVPVDTKQEPVWTWRANGFKNERNLRTDATVIDGYNYRQSRSADIQAFGPMH